MRLLRLLVVATLALMLGACMEALQEVRTPTARPVVPPVRTAEPSASTSASATDAPDATPTTASEVPPPAEPTTTSAEAAPSSQPQPINPALPARSYEERWRSQQINRQVLPAIQSYQTTGSDLWWYDPVNQQHLVLGNFAGAFEVQATFTRSTDQSEALEVPYQVNQRYGLTALSPALVSRIQAAGYGEWIETYVLKTSDVSIP